MPGSEFLNDLLESEKLDDAGIDGRMEANAAFIRTDRAVELHAESAVYSESLPASSTHGTRNVMSSPAPRFVLEYYVGYISDLCSNTGIIESINSFTAW